MSRKFARRTLLARVLTVGSLAAVGFLANAARPTPAAAQEGQSASFRVDTDIYTDLSKPPIKRTLTLFSEGVFYDFGTDDDRLLTVIDPLRGRIVLIDETRLLRATVDCGELQRRIDAAAAQAPPELVRVLTAQWQDTPAGKECTVGNDGLQYTCTVVAPPAPDAALQFASFADWSARLNATRPPSLVPCLRLRLNAMVAEAGVLPSKITRTAKGNEIYAVSSPIWQLSGDDRQRIRSAGELMASAAEVSPEKFWEGR